MRLAGVVPEQAAGHTGPVTRVQVARIGVLCHLALIGSHGRSVIAAEEVAVSHAGLRVLAHEAGIPFQIVLEPFEGLFIIGLLEVGVGHLVRNKLAFRTGFQGRQVVQVREDVPGLRILAVPVQGLCLIIPGQLVKAFPAGAVVGGCLQMRHGAAPGAAFHELPGAEEVGFHVVGLHIRAKFVDVVIGLHGAHIVVVLESHHGHIGIDLVSLFERVVLLQVLLERGGIPVKVERQLGVIVQGVFLDIRRKTEGRCFLECIHGRHLVAQLDVAVTQLIRGNLAQGVRAVFHPGEVFHGTFPVLNHVIDFSGIEKVAPGEFGLVPKVFLIITARLFYIALDEVGLAHDAGQMRLTVFRNFVEQVFSEAEDIIIVLLIEAALQDVVVGKCGETVVLCAELEPGSGLLEILLGIVDIAQGVIRRSGIVRIREVFHTKQKALGTVPLPLRKSTVPQLVGIFRALSFLDILEGHLIELLQGFLVPLLVKKVQAQLIAHLRHQEVFMIAGDKRLGNVMGMGGFELERAKGAITFCHGGVVALDKAECLRIHAGLVQVFHLPEVLCIQAVGQA